jgi:hypothetical protein
MIDCVMWLLVDVYIYIIIYINSMSCDPEMVTMTVQVVTCNWQHH